MRYDDIRSLNDAFTYFLDCQLATVEELAIKKSKSKHDYKRHIEIAQKMINNAKEYGVNVKHTRAENIINDGLTVEQWATAVDNKFNPH